LQTLLLRHQTESDMSQSKSASLQCLGETSATHLRRLLASHELGDDKSSVLLQCLRNLAKGQVTDEVLRTIFMEQLKPEYVRTILAISEMSDLSKLAMQADKILEMAKPLELAVQAVDAETGTIGKLTADIAALTKQMAKLTKQTRGRPVVNPRNAKITEAVHKASPSRIRTKTKSAIIIANLVLKPISTTPPANLKTQKSRKIRKTATVPGSRWRIIME